MRQHDHRVNRKIRLIAVKMEARHVGVRHLVEHPYGGIGHHLTLFLGQHRTGILRLDQIIVTVSQALDEPGRFDIDKHRFIVRGAAGGQNTGDPHFQGIDAGNVKHLLWRRINGPAWMQVPFPRHPGSHHAIAQPRDHAPLRYLQMAEVKVLQFSPHNGRALGTETQMQRNRLHQPGIANFITSAQVQRLGRPLAKMQGAQHQVRLTALGARHQGR